MSTPVAMSDCLLFSLFHPRPWGCISSAQVSISDRNLLRQAAEANSFETNFLRFGVLVEVTLRRSFRPRRGRFASLIAIISGAFREHVTSTFTSLTGKSTVRRKETRYKAVAISASLILLVLLPDSRMAWARSIGLTRWHLTFTSPLA